LEEISVVNAFATDHKEALIRLEVSATPPAIAIFGGICDAFKAAALGVAFSEQQGDIGPLIRCFQGLGQQIWQTGGRFGPQGAATVLESLEIDLSDWCALRDKANTYFRGTTIWVLAHELGHICYGHTTQGDYASDEQSRQMERDADGFASSVINAIHYKDYNIYAGAVECMLWVWIVENETRPAELTSHPHPRERLYNFLRANESGLQALGITRRNIDGFLPPTTGGAVEYFAKSAR
jgi:hypothetical protein